MDQQAHVPEVVVDDRSCISCGYNLRGLPCAGVCSECGASVSESLRDDLLQNASREYLTELLLGHRIVLITILVSIIVAVLAAIATYALGGSPGVHVTGHREPAPVEQRPDPREREFDVILGVGLRPEVRRVIFQVFGEGT